MDLNKIKIKNNKGFSLVEVLIFSLIVVIVVVIFYKTFASGSKVLRDARARTAAAQVANEKFETMRNLPYGDLVAPSETVENDFERSSIKFKVETDINYANDPYDDPVSPASDEKPHDYKHIRVSVSWMNSGEEKNITMYTHIAPPGTEELYDGGILNIEIRDTDEFPVKGAEVRVEYLEDGTVSTFTTGDNGKVYLIGYTAGDEDYYITVQKNNYYPVATLPPLGPSPDGSPFDPVDENATVVENGITSMTIHLEELASMQFKTIDPFGIAVGNIDFSLEGGRKIGDLAGVNVYSHTKTNESSNVSGEFVLSGDSPGNYIYEYLTTGTNNANYEFWKLDPAPIFGMPANSFYLAPGITSSVNMILISKTVPSLFLTVLDKVDSTPIADAIVRVTNVGLAYDKQMITDKYGKVYFPIDEDPLVPLIDGQEYTMEVAADGYSNTSPENITISGLTKRDILME